MSGYEELHRSSMRGLHLILRVINHYVKADRWNDALTALRKQSNAELYYKFSPVLMQNAPRETVEIWKAAKNRLDPSRLAKAEKTKNTMLTFHVSGDSSAVAQWVETV